MMSYTERDTQQNNYRLPEITNDELQRETHSRTIRDCQRLPMMSYTERDIQQNN